VSTPFIIVSGTLGEDAAIESLRNGATDYVLKGRLSRLGPAVRRAMKEAEATHERKKLEEQFRHAQKMEAVGRLAAGVAHDFNNLLTAIIGYTELMQRLLPEGSPAMRDSGEVLDAAERAAALTRQLLLFSRQQVQEPRVFDLNHLVSNTDRLLRRLIGTDVDLRTALAADLAPIKADPGQIEQVLMNLAVNARDAMPSGGRLTIETSNVEVDPHYHSALPPGRYVVLSVADSGCGMSPETQSRIFEPFFTTKEVGKGTGLGLSTVHGIVQQGGGHVEVSSELGVGTVFKVFLPSAAAGAALEDRAERELPTRGHETVLVVDDDPHVRNVVVRMLRHGGYAVLEAAEPGDAMSCAHEHAARIDVILTDVMLPAMNGPELARGLRRLHPEAKVLFMSGYTDHAILHQGLLGSDAAYLPKPFTAEALLRQIRKLLDAEIDKAA
jgi:signal transduction histidine kinase/ActR/RegA family two-component response regulator